MASRKRAREPSPSYGAYGRADPAFLQRIFPEPSPLQSRVLEEVDDCHWAALPRLLQAFVDDTAFLNGVGELLIQKDIYICRVTALSGRAVVTAFCCIGEFNFPDWQTDCLGLDRLFDEVPSDATSICRGRVATSRTWRSFMAGLEPAKSPLEHLGLDLGCLNEIQVVIP